jgi:hypothetical protein
MELTFEYADLIVAAATANSYVYQWAPNTGFDPNYTAAGAQPVGWDEWTALFTAYRVVSFEIDTQVSMRTATSSLAVACAATVGAPGSADYFDIAGARYSKMASTTSGAEPAKLKLSLSVAEVMGVLPITALTDDSFQAAMTGTPSRQVIYTVAIETAGATDTISICQRLRMKTRLERPKILSVSLASRVHANPAPCLEARLLRERAQAETKPAIGSIAAVPSLVTCTVQGPVVEPALVNPVSEALPREESADCGLGVYCRCAWVADQSNSIAALRPTGGKVSVAPPGQLGSCLRAPSRV